MKPRDLTLEDLKKIPIEDYDEDGYALHPTDHSAMCCNRAVLEIHCMFDDCVSCVIDTPKQLKAKIKELES